ncbi:MAG: S1 RNA-binding domain-containing protein [Candidatus Omnitrophica bacterium]|nr:S1 RNA-binding domain-containing protein [Candidatus Omnitrophota bacterium]
MIEETIKELEDAYYNSIKELKEGEIVKGKILGFTSNEVIVDVGYKAEGIIPLYEFAGLDLNNLSDIDVYVENVEDEEGRIILSFKKARETVGWQTLINEYKEGDLVEGIITRKVKGGYMVNVLGVEGFLPQSLSTFKNTNEQEVLNKKYYFQIVKISKLKENFILSRKDALKQEKELLRKKMWEGIEVGKIVKGKVKSITNFGAFIDLGGIDGLLHIADMSWKKITHPSELVAVGDELNLIILDFDQEKNRVSLGLKQLTPDPWQEIGKKYPIDSIVKGRITNIQNYGIFVELEKGIEGLVHISEISWLKNTINLQESFAVGDTVEAKVINIDSQEHKISLSIKRLENDPWENADNLIIMDSIVKATVTSYGENCAYLELENGFGGIIYNEDISWTKKINKAQEVLKKSHTYDFKVIGIDKVNRRIILGLKQLKPDPWPQILEKFPIGTVLEGEVVKITNFGVFVKLDEELEGLVFSGEIEKEKLSTLKPKDKLKVKIIKIDASSAKIGLSAKIDQPPQETKATP